MLDQNLDCIDSRLLRKAGSLIMSVEVLVEHIHAVIAVEDAIRVEHGHHHEHKIFEQQVGSQVVAEQEVEHALEGVAGGGLARVDPGRDQDDGLAGLELEWPAVVGEKSGQLGLEVWQFAVV
jgi:hypothetical protein